MQPMLSQRRSSEQTSQSTHSTPSQLRLESALRHVDVLFSTTAFQENHTRPESPAPSQPASRTSEASAVRRMFSREPRRPPVHSRLAVAANLKNPHVIRIYHLVDYGTNTRPLIHRSWNISDIRRIDGLGQPVAESVLFALHFIPTKVFIFRTQSPKTRAKFLWSLLQTCVSQLKRAPPVQHLRLLDLQTLAEASAPADDDHPSIRRTASESSRARSADATGAPSDVPPTHISEASTKKNSSRTIQSKLTSPDASRNDLDRKEQSQDPSPRPADVQTQQDRLGSQARRGQQFPRAFSEPKLSDSSQKRSEPSLEDDSSQEAPRSEHVRRRDSYVDQLAFEAAAKRFGRKRSSAVINGSMEAMSNLDSDPKALWFENRRKPNEANTKVLMEQMRMRRQRKQAKLSDEERANLLYTLEMFSADNNDHLHEFGKWLESYIQKLEVENIGDIVDVESCEPCHETAEHEYSRDTVEREDLHDVLIKSIAAADPWLRECESLLEPYASLSQEIHDEITLLETQRKNIRALQVELDTLLHSISFSDQEQKLVDSLEVILAAEEDSIDYSDLYDVIYMLTSKSNEISKLKKLSGMSAVKDALRLISEKQNRASKLVLPGLKSCLEDIYAERQRAVSTPHEIHLKHDSSRPSLQEERVGNFRRGLQCIAECENNVYSQIIDHYVELSSSWTTNFLRFSMHGEPPLSLEKNALDGRVERFAENLLYGCLIESHLAFSLFNNDLRDKETTLPTVLRRQLPSPEVLSDFLKRQDQKEDELEANAHQHFWRALEIFSNRLTNFSERYLEEVVARVEKRLGLLYNSFEMQFPFDVLKIGDIERSNEAVMEALDSFQTKCRVLCVSSQRLVDMHANVVMAKLSQSIDLRRESQRYEFFSRVRKSVDLSSELSRSLRTSSREGLGTGSGFNRSLCEKLIRATLRRTEVVSATAGERADDVKLQCFGYVAAKLGESSDEDYVLRLIRLADRLREHVMVRWVDRNVVRKMFHDLFQDAPGRSSESFAKLRAHVMGLDASGAAGAIRMAVHSSLEGAAKTCMIVPFYEDLISLVKERMDEMLRRNRGNRHFSELRPKLRSFTADLLSILQSEVEELG
eukprot:TRINITY_DN47820_c0_g1_i1.p1 TRINITY_DN47820_c0_g1~~TRINITY_DN47820_c0_g1_i1.p1  ORF type:complete len:1098 (-),score=182.60 TRINITY_DN47820_c0_g1_i1:3936-7229(-)